MGFQERFLEAVLFKKFHDNLKTVDIQVFSICFIFLGLTCNSVVQSKGFELLEQQMYYSFRD